MIEIIIIWGVIALICLFFFMIVEEDFGLFIIACLIISTVIIGVFLIIIGDRLAGLILLLAGMFISFMVAGVYS